MSQNLPAAVGDSEGDAGDIYSFVVRVWKEETGAAQHHVVWRGHITRIPGNLKIYFSKLEEIAALIISQLEDPGDPIPSKIDDSRGG